MRRFHLRPWPNSGSISAIADLFEYIEVFYNRSRTERLHQALAYRTPHEVHYAITG